MCQYKTLNSRHFVVDITECDLDGDVNESDDADEASRCLVVAECFVKVHWQILLDEDAGQEIRECVDPYRPNDFTAENGLKQ